MRIYIKVTVKTVTITPYLARTVFMSVVESRATVPSFAGRVARAAKPALTTRLNVRGSCLWRITILASVVRRRVVLVFHSIHSFSL